MLGRFCGTAIVVLGVVMGAGALAQERPMDEPQRPPMGPPGGQARMDFDGVKKQLGVTDEEWKVVGVQIRRVMGLQRTASVMALGMGGGGQMRGPRGGRDSFAGPGGGGDGRRREGEGPRGGPDGQPTGEGGRQQGPPAGDAVRPQGQPAGDGVRPQGPPGMGGGGGAVGVAVSDLQSALADKDSTAEMIKEKVAAVRNARVKAREELAGAQKELAELLTEQQQAVLVGLGVLE